ncbi:DUF6493 family protein [Nonomuraea antimicrobica]|uniref:DUF6493 family protein n=1 Tax=Nonomuraea antimicrobica TaxID=561173 RepID=UPI0031E7BFA4
MVRPEADPLVLAWVSTAPDAVTLRDDPLLDDLLPLLFDAEGVGAVLRDERADPPEPRSWLGALVRLAGEGRVGRDLLLDGCLRRFQRGGQAADLRFFVRLHELLDPTYDEVSKRRHDYLRLLPATPGTVAETALRQVRRLDDLEPDEVTRALRALLSRSERKLLTAGLTWLDEIAAAGDPAVGLDELGPVLGHSFACESADVQGRAVRVAVKHAKLFTGAGALGIRDAIGVLPLGLRETLAEVFGGESGESGEHRRDPDGFTPVPLPEPVRAGPFRAPVLTAGELDGLPDDSRWEAAELWLAGVVRLYGRDRDGLAARLADKRPAGGAPPGRWLEVSQWAEEIVRLVTGGPEAQERRLPGGPAAREGLPGGPAAREGLPGGSPARERLPGDPAAWARRLPGGDDVPGPHLFLLLRWAEVAQAIEGGTPPPYLLAEPTEATGHVDAGELVERLAGYERDGVTALPADLRQALLRLPREIAPDVVTRAGTLTSEAGRTAAYWMAGGRPETITEIDWCYRPPVETPGHDDRRVYGDDRESAGSGSMADELLPRLRLRPAPPVADGVPPVPPGERVPVGGLLVGGLLVGGLLVGGLLDGGLLDGAVEPRLTGHGGYLRWWPYLMPSHREAVAAQLVPYLFERWQRPRAEPSQALALAAAEGPAGEAVALVLAYFAADRAWSAAPERRARPLVDMAARGHLDAERVGRQLALLVRRTDLKPGPVFETLESAAALGAHREVWRVVAGFLPVFLPGPGERSHTRHTQSLVFALRAARWARARGALACVAEIAKRRASNNFVREARRLHTYLL